MCCIRVRTIEVARQRRSRVDLSAVAIWLKPYADTDLMSVLFVERLADVAQLVEHSLGKGEVISSILIIGSRNWVVEVGGPGSFC